MMNTLILNLFLMYGLMLIFISLKWKDKLIEGNAAMPFSSCTFIHPLVSGSQGAGTDDDVLIEILASRTGEQIKDIIKVYKKGESFC